MLVYENTNTTTTTITIVIIFRDSFGIQRKRNRGADLGSVRSSGNRTPDAFGEIHLFEPVAKSSAQRLCPLHPLGLAIIGTRTRNTRAHRPVVTRTMPQNMANHPLTPLCACHSNMGRQHNKTGRHRVSYAAPHGVSAEATRGAYP